MGAETAFAIFTVCILVLVGTRWNKTPEEDAQDRIEKAWKDATKGDTE